jgi:DNA polymerase III epsilon subunit
MREIVLDTETTGLDPINGDRLVEIGCVEVFNHIATGETYHQYINPQRDMPAGAFAVHGLSEEFLSGYPVFRDVVDAFLDFVGDDPLVIHNASFDMGFINAELRRLKRRELPMSQAVDTVRMARRKFPGAPASLDAKCIWSCAAAVSRALASPPRKRPASPLETRTAPWRCRSKSGHPGRMRRPQKSLPPMKRLSRL